MNDQMKEYLCHMTDAEKKAYNAEYYRNHKNYWQDYYSKGQTVGRPTARQKYVTEGGNGVNRRGEGLGTGPVGSSSNKKRLTIPFVEHETNITTFPNGTTTTTHTPVEINIPGEQAIKKFGKNLISDIKSGQKTAIDAGKQFAKDWINGAKSLFKKKPVVVTNTWSGTAGGQHISGSNSFVLRGKKK